MIASREHWTFTVGECVGLKRSPHFDTHSGIVAHPQHAIDREAHMNERNARAEHNTQYSVPPIFDGDLEWGAERNEIRNPGNGSAASKRPALNSKDEVKNGSEAGERSQANEKSHEPS